MYLVIVQSSLFRTNAIKGPMVFLHNNESSSYPQKDHNTHLVQACSTPPLEVVWPEGGRGSPRENVEIRVQNSAFWA